MECHSSRLNLCCVLSPSQPHRPPCSYLHPSLKRNEDGSARFVLPTSVGWHREYKHMSRTCKDQALASRPGLYFVRHNYRRRLDPAGSWLNLRCYYGKRNGQHLYAVPSWGSQTSPGWPVKRSIPNAEYFPVGWMLIHVSPLPTSRCLETPSKHIFSAHPFGRPVSCHWVLNLVLPWVQPSKS